MGVICQILINKLREGVYKPGMPVSGAVKYAVDEPTEYRDVTLSFLGRGKCRWKEGSGRSSTQYYGSEEYITQDVNITNKTPQEAITLHGVYEYPFEFYLPDDIPTSYDKKKDQGTFIAYSIQLKFVKTSFFSFNKVFTAEIPVYGFVDWKTADGISAADTPVIFGLKKSLFAPFSANKPIVKIIADITKACLTPGESALVSYVVINDTDVAITSVQACLYYYITYTANCGRTRQWCSKVKQCKVEMPGIPGREVTNFTCAVPTLPELYSIQCSRIISREYRVRLTARLPVPHMNAVAEMPVVIGERKGSAEPFHGAGLPPPSYWEGMSEEKEQGKRKT